ncbi:MAG: SagB/ThcOx family dehydrogenase [Halanaeroarchaeum sp.]
MSGSAADPVSLPEPAVDAGTDVLSAIRDRRSRRSFTDEPLSRDALGTLCWAAQGITDRESGFRAAPSAGATFPLSVSVVAGADGVTDFDAGVYRYDHDAHALEGVRDGDVREELQAASLDQSWVGTAPVSFVLAATPERTTRQYGDRGRERYVPMEVGHVGQNLYLVAEALDLGTVHVGAFEDDAVDRIVGTADDENAMAIFPVGVPR